MGSKYDIFEFEMRYRILSYGTEPVIYFRISLGNDEFYELGFFTKENIEKLKIEIEKMDKRLCQK